MRAEIREITHFDMNKKLIVIVPLQGMHQQ